MFRALAASVLLFTMLVGAAPRVAAADPISVQDDTQKNNWPNNVTFSLKLQSDADINRIKLEYWYTDSGVQAAGNPEFTPGKNVTAQFVLRTSGQNSYVPPGALITYRYVIEDSAGNTLRTEPKSYRYLDTRYKWQTMTSGLVTLYYANASESRMQPILQGGVSAIQKFKERFGYQLQSPITVVAYNTAQELNQAQQRTLAPGLISVGTQYSGFDVILVTADSQGVSVTEHETTHYIVDEIVGITSGASISNFPLWLNEGMAVYAQSDGGREYAEYLTAAIRGNRVLPLRQLASYPGKAEETLLLYGAGVSVVRYLVSTYGGDKMYNLLVAYREGNTDDGAFMKAYGKNLTAIDNEWRKSLGIPPIDDTTSITPGTGPSAIPTLPPLFGGNPGGSSPSGSPTPAPAAPSTPQPQPTAQPAQQQPSRLMSSLPLVIGGVVVVGLLVIGVLAVAVVSRNRV